MQFFKLYASCSAIPKHLLDKAKGKQVDKRTFLAENAFQLSPNTAIDLHKMKNRDYYWLLINKDDVEIKACPKWARDLNCHQSKHFFAEVIKRGNKENGTSFSPSPLEILFGLEQKDYPQVANQSIIKFNYTLLFAKCYLYTQKLLRKEIKMKEFIRKIASKLQIEKLS